MSRRNLIPTDVSQGINMRSASPDPTTGRFSQTLADRAAQNFPKYSRTQKIPSSKKFDSQIKITRDSSLSPPSTLSLQDNLPPSPKPKPKPQARRTRKKNHSNLICPPGCVPESRLAGKINKKNKKNKKNKSKKKKRKTRRNYTSRKK
ncbi:MAG: hypothetical protein CL669_05190 [Balneola sp.]|nr:hypothetical protein [Balneola sp.]